MDDASQPAKAITRRTKVFALIPVAIASAVATTLVLMNTGSTEPIVTTSAVVLPLPEVTPVPVQELNSQATISRRGRIAPAISDREADTVVAATTTSGIPAVALNAYQRAAQVINASDPTCHMPWELLGAIGRVESDHGRFDGSQLTADGQAVPAIYGLVLNGKHHTAVIRDTDGGSLDHNITFDRAVGPMQFLPSTWAAVAVDANGDGERDPQNIYDASLGSAVYLCSGQGDLATTAGQKKAVYRYNQSHDYVKLVLALTQAYQQRNFSAVPFNLGDAAAKPSESASPKPHKKHKKKASPKPSPKPSSSTPTPTASSSPSPSATPTSPAAEPMTKAEARVYCGKRLGLQALVWGPACTNKLTGLTPAEADAGWNEHQKDLGAWFRS